MFPTGGGGGGGAYLSVVGETIYGTQPFAYSDDYSQSYLHARIWSTTRNAAFSFSDVQAAVIPEPCTVALLAGACGGLVVTSFRKRRRGPQR